MSIRFNADEVLKMAEEIEVNGAKFYRRAAALHKKHAAFLQKLAKMEDQHKAVFSLMRAKLPETMKEDTAFDPYMEASLYLNSMADSHGGEGAPSAAESLSGKESMEDILLMAVGLEEKSIAFYVGAMDMVPKNLGKAQVQDIITEEKNHVAALVAELKKLR